MDMFGQQQQQHHENERVLKCTKCDYTTNDMRVLEVHMGKGHGKAKIFKCKTPNCQYVAPEIFRLKRHMQSMHMEKVYRFNCKLCDYKGLYKHYLDKHMKEVHCQTKEFCCDLCPYTTSRKGSLEGHIVSIHENSRPFGCPYCPHGSNSKRGLKRHINDKHEVEKKKKRKGEKKSWDNVDPNDQMQMCDKLNLFYCSLCDVSLCSRTQLRKHMMAKHPELKLHKCNQCDEFETSNKRELNQHIRNVHEKIKDHFCTQCDFAGASLKSLRYHVFAVHTARHMFQCQHCDYQTPRRDILARHKDRKHLEDMKSGEEGVTKSDTEITNCELKHHPIFCKHCNFQCYEDALLEEHLLTGHKASTVNKDDQPVKYFNCSQCEHFCSSAKKLKQHVSEAHSLKEVFRCDQCDFVGPNESDLKHHVFVAHKKCYFFKCERCEFKTKQQAQLRTHLEIEHGLIMDYPCPFCDFAIVDKHRLIVHIQKSHFQDQVTKSEPVSDGEGESGAEVPPSNLCQVTMNYDELTIHNANDDLLENNFANLT